MIFLMIMFIVFSLGTLFGFILEALMSANDW